jgi:hypothetical protein
MQTFPPLCIYNFGLPRRTPSPRPSPPPRAISLRPSARPPAAARARRPSSCRARPPSQPRASTDDDVRGHVWTTYAATARERRWTFPRGDLPSEEDGGGRSRTDANDDGDERRTRLGLGGDRREDLGWAATGGDLAWAATGTHDIHQNGTKEKNTRARSVKKISGVGFTLWVCQV